MTWKRGANAPSSVAAGNGAAAAARRRRRFSDGRAAPARRRLALLDHALEVEVAQRANGDDEFFERVDLRIDRRLLAAKIGIAARGAHGGQALLGVGFDAGELV